jgi:hypothetical protein
MSGLKRVECSSKFLPRTHALYIPVKVDKAPPRQDVNPMGVGGSATKGASFQPFWRCSATTLV